MIAILQLLLTAAFGALLVWGVMRALRKGVGGGGRGAIFLLAVLALLALFLSGRGALGSLSTGASLPIRELRDGAVLIGTLVGLVWLIGLLSRGQAAGGDTILRGSRLLSAEHLNQFMYGKEWTPSTASQVLGSPNAIHFGGAIVPREFESQHMLFSGTTGSGKTQAINRIMKAIRSRQRRAMVADAAGGFLSRFYQSGDLILNPFDKRSVDWSPFAEIRADYDCARIAKAAIPDGHGESLQWHQYAQTLLGETMLAMHHRGQTSIKQLLHYLTVADPKELGELLAGTPAVILCAKGNDKMLSNTRGIIGTYLVVWRYLPDQGHFSVRNWIEDDSKSAWLFLPYRDNQLGMLRTLIASFLELGLIEALSLAEDPKRDLWFVMDEVDSLGKITSLATALSKLRKYGCKCVLGLQTIAQLRATYGDDGAQSLLANIATKLILRAGDGETAEYFSAEFGDQEVEREQHSSSNASTRSGILGKGGSTSSSSNVTRIRDTKRTVLASDISALRDLHGYLKITSSPIAFIGMSYEEIEQTTPAYVEGGAGSLRAAPAPAFSLGSGASV
jgi:hypothetical protein